MLLAFWQQHDDVYAALATAYELHSTQSPSALPSTNFDFYISTLRKNFHSLSDESHIPEAQPSPTSSQHRLCSLPSPTMGRLAKHIAATAAFADNMPPADKLPSVSLIDALLPRIWSMSSASKKNHHLPPTTHHPPLINTRNSQPSAVLTSRCPHHAQAMWWHPFIGLFVPKIKVSLLDSNTQQPLDPYVQMPPGSIHTDIKKDKDGKMVMVRHRSKNDSVVNGNNNVAVKNAKKNKNDNDGGKDTGGDGAAFTAEEDAKLKEFKESNTTWKNIAAEMSRAQHELKARWKEIEGKPDTGGDQKKNDGGGKDNKADGNDQKDGGGDFSKEDDDKIKEMLASNTGFKKIAQALGRNLDGLLKDHINKLKAETGGDNAKNDKGDKGDKKNDDDFSKKDKQKIKELLESGTGYKQIAEALGRARVDQPLKDEIAKIKAEGGGDKKKDEGGSKDKEKKKDGDGGGKNENKKDKEKSKKDEPKKAASNAPSHRSHRSEARFTIEEWKALQGDELFTFDELQLLSEIIMRDPGQSWLAVASRFLDKTGRRVHPDDVRDKFDQMAKIRR
ncbi:hypothetical protein M409DRAFT_61101 [Zasmidium cellare ATCC 36951]|uniref:Myb-like domain-containing protein n=1 Tax=Zasmidium cellare ATCC 36951 TaxID=1080233 RepID=A0A6A6BZY5_ZASCE|nr:uncharacterized protein M409DRAFT_61101 [Zasmidium cellare ATCC 36951]KAF2159152.1 hypothetical protein M409DRAFT_61101 [Zasmidium cellare ATCC 36951]